MSSVTKADAALIGAFVTAVLQTDDGLSGFQLFVGKFAYIFGGFFRSDARVAEFMSLRS